MLSFSSVIRMKESFEEITVVIPTLNEKETIEKLINAILKNYPKIKIIVADDNSTDGTISIVKRISSKDRNVKLLERKGRKRGLTASVIDGISASKTKYVVVMDADMQHPFEVIKEIKKKFDEGYNLVVATRASVKNWALHRKIISRLLIYVGYLVLYLEGSARCGDIFSGYFGVKKELFENVYKANEKRFVGEGYKVLFDLLKCINSKDAKIAEVPYVFHVRSSGSSKAGVKQGIALFKSFFS
jgi:dolichol-phosphate mannosyltransferase